MPKKSNSNRKSTKKYSHTETSSPDKDSFKEISSSTDMFSTSLWPGDITFNPDKLARKITGFKVYDNMRHDEQIKAAQNLKKNAVLKSGWQIIPASEDKEDIQRKEFLESTLKQMKGTIEDNLFEIMSASDYGFSITEKVFELISKGEFQGKIGLKALKTRRPHGWDFILDEHGNIKENGLVQSTSAVPQVEHNPNKFIHYIFNQEFQNPYGNSDLRSAYRAWWGKDNFIKFWMIYGQRAASPVAKGTYDKTILKPLQEEIKKILNSIQSATNIMIPEGVDVDWLESSGNNQLFYQRSIEWLDQAILKALLMPNLIGMGSQGGTTGTFAQSKVQFDTFMLVIERIRRQIEETIMFEQLIKPLIDWNWENVEKYPKFNFLPIKEDDKFEIAKIWISAVKDQVVGIDLDDENQLRQLLGFPEKKEQTTIISDKTSEKENRQKKDEEKKEFKEVNVEQNLDNLENEALDNSIAVLTKQKQNLLKRITKEFKNGTLRDSIKGPKFVETLKLTQIKKLEKVFRTLMGDGYNQGLKDVKTQSFAQITTSAMNLKPTEALKFFENKDFWITGVIDDDILNETKRILLNGIQNGDPLNFISEQIEEIYVPFLGDPNTLQNAVRLETIIRTNLNEAYNAGRLALGNDPALTDFIIGWEYSEILDTRTTDISKFIDGKKIKKSDPDLPRLSYPLHFNDRGLFTPVTIDDKPVTWITTTQKNKLKSMIGKFK